MAGLTPSQLQAFITDGVLHLPPDPALADTVAELHHSTTRLFEAHDDPGNTLLPALPALHTIAEAPAVVGALTGLLGPGYLLHPHRRAHPSRHGRQTQAWHKDTYKGRQYHPVHRLEWVMLMVYPQRTTLSLGPTAVQPGSQYFRGDYGIPHRTQAKRWGVAERVLTCEAGAAVLIHYDIWHRALRNTATDAPCRWMHKLQFTRMRPPSGGLPEWALPDDPRSPIWADVWRWLGGTVRGGVAPVSAADLHHPEEQHRLAAAHRMATQPGGAAVLAEALSESRKTGVRRTLVYGLIAAGDAGPLVGMLTPTGRRSEPGPTAQQRRKQEGFDLELAHEATDRDAEQLYCAALALSHIPAAVPHLRDLCQRSDVPLSASIAAAEGLGRLGGGPASVAALVALLGHPCADLESTAALALARLADDPACRAAVADALPDIAGLSQSPDRYSRAYAAATAARLAPGATPASLRAASAGYRCPLTTPHSRW